MLFKENFKILLWLVIIGFSNHSVIIGQEFSSSDKGYKYYQKNQFEDAIDYWESQFGKRSKSYEQAVKYLTGKSHNELSSLYMLSSELVSQAQLIYLDSLIEEPNVDKVIVNLYRAATLIEADNLKEAKKLLNKIKSSRLRKHHKGYFNLLKKSVEIKAVRVDLLKVGVRKNISKNFNKAQLTQFQNTKYRLYNALFSGDIKTAKSIIKVIDKKGLDYTDKSVKSREIRFYDLEIYRMLNLYHLHQAENIFKGLLSSTDKAISKNSSIQLAEIYFLLNKKEELKELSKKNPNVEEIGLFAGFLEFISGNNKHFISNLKKIKNEGIKGKIGFYLARFNLCDEGLGIIDSAFRRKKTKLLQFYLAYAFFKSGGPKNIAQAETIFLSNYLYTRRKTSDFQFNKPIRALLYSRIMFQKSPKNSCPETIGIARVLAQYFEAFSLYHNALQGTCLFYSALGGGNVILD